MRVVPVLNVHIYTSILVEVPILTSLACDYKCVPYAWPFVGLVVIFVQ